MSRILKSFVQRRVDSDIVADTNSKLVCGDYPLEKGINITYGCNKEHRRGLKQFKIGLITKSKGHPVSADILEGDIDDKN